MPDPTEAVSAASSGAIEDILVRRFNLDYENIYIFCLLRPSDNDRRRFACHWEPCPGSKHWQRPKLT